MWAPACLETTVDDVSDGAVAPDTEAPDPQTSGGVSNGETTTVGSGSDHSDTADASTSETTGDATGSSTTQNNTSDADVTETTDAQTDTSDAASDASSDAQTTSEDGGTQRAAVDLGQAENYVILAKSAISATGGTAIVGDVGLSPADATYITGFGLDAPPTTFSTSDLVTGKIWASDYDAPTPVNLTEAVLDMEAAYTDAAGRTLPDATELGAGNLDGLTLNPGLYKWGTGVNVPNNVTLEGSSSDVWILQIGQDLLLGNGASVTLAGGAQPGNVFWQVAGQATLGTTSSFQGILLSQTLIEFNTGATMTGRAFAQTAVTLDTVVLTAP
jgi:Ice-binding-like